MYDEVYPGAWWMPGRNAGWASGRSAMSNVKQHYTVGVDSTGIGLDGYFTWLIGKDGTVKQFAEASCICWDSGEWNGTGPGIEFERLGDWEPLTPGQIASGGALNRWLSEQWGLWLALYDTNGDNSQRVPVGGAPAPYITHRSLIQSQQHVDYVTYDDWAAMLGVPGDGGFLMALSDEQQHAIYNILWTWWTGKNPGADGAPPPWESWTRTGPPYMVQDELGRVLVHTGSRLYEVDYATFKMLVDQGMKNWLGFDSRWVAAEQARLDSFVGGGGNGGPVNLTPADIEAIAVAVADEQARRLIE